jgi:hypothetical protein
MTVSPPQSVSPRVQERRPEARPRQQRGLRGRRGWVLPLLLFTAWALWLSFPYLAHGAGSYVKIFDNGDSTLAARVALGTSDPSHAGTAWNPSALGGLDQVPLSTTSDLDVVIFRILPGWFAYGLVMFAQRLIAGYFMYRLLKDRLHTTSLAALAAGVVYAAFFQVTINGEWAGFTLYDGLSLSCLPLVLWGLDGETRWRGPAKLLIAAGLGLLLGVTSHYFAAVFVVLAVAVWLLVRRRAPLRRTLAVIVVFGAAWGIAELPAIWASLLNSAQSQRAHWALVPVSLHAALTRHYYHARGILLDNRVMVAAALLGFAAMRFRSRRLALCLASLAGILLLLLASALWESSIARHAGPLGGFQLYRIYLLAPFVAILAGALGLDAISVELGRRLPAAQPRRGALWAVSLTILVILALGPLASAKVLQRIRDEMRAGSTYAALYERPQVKQLVRAPGNSMPYRVATVYAPQAFSPPPGAYAPELFGQLPDFAQAYGLETADGYVVMYPESYQRFWGAVTAPALRVDTAWRQYYYQSASRAYLILPRTGKPLPPVTDIKTLCNAALLSLDNVRYLISPVRLTGPGLTLTSAEPHGSPWPLYVYENTAWLPRFFLTGGVRSFPDQAGMLAAMSNASLAQLRGTAFLLAHDAAALPSLSSGPGAVALDSYLADDSTLTVTAPADQLLVCTSNYSRFWHAYVDGHERPVRRVDETFLGVMVPAGTHHVELRYQAPYAGLVPG